MSPVKEAVIYCLVREDCVMGQMSAIGEVQRSSLHAHQLRCYIKAASGSRCLLPGVRTWPPEQPTRSSHVRPGVITVLSHLWKEDRASGLHTRCWQSPSCSYTWIRKLRLLPTCEHHVPSQANTWGLRVCPDDSHLGQMHRACLW